MQSIPTQYTNQSCSALCKPNSPASPCFPIRLQPAATRDILEKNSRNPRTPTPTQQIAHLLTAPSSPHPNKSNPARPSNRPPATFGLSFPSLNLSHPAMVSL